MQHQRTESAELAALLRRGADQLARGDPAGALATFEDGVRRFPGDWRARANAATLCYERGRRGEAVRMLGRALELAPHEAALCYKLGGWLFDLGATAGALRLFERGAALEGDQASAHLRLASSYLEAKDCARSERAVRRALELAPEHPEAHALLGLVLGALGRVAESTAALERALALEPACALAAYHLVRRGGDVDPAPLAARLASGRASVEERAKICFTLGYLHERRGEHAASFAHFARANALRPRAWSPDAHARIVDDLIATCTRAFFAERGVEPGRSDGGPPPVFVVGLPRTGSTLLQQILAGHPRVHAVGEHAAGFPRLARELARLRPGVRGYPAGLADLTPGDRAACARLYRASLPPAPAPDRVPVDKLLANFQALGLIALCFPDARVVHCMRDPRDSGLSCFALEFQRNEQPWTYDLDHIARYYRDHDRLHAHWRAHLPLPMLDVRYEDLVRDPEGETRRLLAFLDLPWDARCLALHRREAPVFTASAVQVREALHRRAVERWKPYAAFLGPLHAVARARALRAAG